MALKLCAGRLFATALRHEPGPVSTRTNSPPAMIATHAAARFASCKGEPVPHNTTCSCPSFSNPASTVAPALDCCPEASSDDERSIANRVRVVITTDCMRLCISFALSSLREIRMGAKIRESHYRTASWSTRTRLCGPRNVDVKCRPARYDHPSAQYHSSAFVSVPRESLD